MEYCGDNATNQEIWQKTIYAEFLFDEEKKHSKKN